MGNRSVSKEILISTGQFSKEREYWLKKLSGDLSISRFPYDFNKPVSDDIDTDMVKLRIEGELFSRLLAIADNSDSRLFIILVTGLVFLLHKYTGHEDIILGTPIDKQTSEGEFINTVLALRNRLSAVMTFRELLFQVRQCIVEAHENQNYPLETIAYEMNMPVEERDGFFLFATAALLGNIHDKRYIQHIRLPMLFSFSRVDQHINIEVQYNPSLYEKKNVGRITHHFVHSLENALRNVDRKIVDLDILTGQEKEFLSVQMNDTAMEYPASRTIGELFAQQVEKTPDDTAVEEADSGRRMSYRVLNEHANQLARELTGRGVGPGTIAAIMGERKIEIIIGILGILKAGGVYLPLDAQNPDDRIKFILEDSGARVFLSQTHIMEKRKDLTANLSPANIISITNEDIYKGEAENPGISNKSTNPAYVMYTSGTSGRPKGVVITHRSLINYICWAARSYVKNEMVDFPLYTSISFDLTVTSIFTPLLTGNKIVIYGGWDKGNLIEKIIDDNKVGAIKSTPSHLSLIRDKKIGKNASNIRRFIVGGEKLEYQLSRDIYENFNGDIEIFNEYGPTEAAVGCMLYKFDPGKNKGSLVSIGVPAGNTRIYLLDKYRNLVSIGAVGEIYVSGAGIARGYLNRPELTNEKFIPSPFVQGGILYRTGDLARWWWDGNIEFLGRIDHQVKIRGFRIELGEIETRLLNCRDIKDAVVVLKNVGKALSLCAYIVSDKELAVSNLREDLSCMLPDYMIPPYFVKLDSMPLTPNGKIDRKALPEPEVKAEARYEPPRNETDEKFVDIWTEVLGIEKESIGINSTFFELGGHSLSAATLTAKIHKVFNVKLRLVDIFRFPTIKELTVFLNQQEEDTFAAVEPVEQREYYSLSSAQKRLYFLQQMDLESKAYNISQCVVLEGDLRGNLLEETFRALIRRHESFRTSCLAVGGEPVQRIHSDVDFSITNFESSESEVEEMIENFSTFFDLGRAPIMRSVLIKLGELQHILLVEMHHIIADGTSMALLMKEFMQVYEGKVLPPMRIQYKDFTRWQNSRKEKEKIRHQEEYWFKEFDGEIPLINLPADYARPPIQKYVGDRKEFHIGKEETLRLKALASDNEATLFMVLMAIFNAFLSNISGQRDIIVGTGVEGRRHEDLRPIIGMFVNTLALRNYPSGDKKFTQFLNEVKERTLEAFENQGYQFDDLVEKLDMERDASRNPLFDVMFQFENIDMPKVEIPGLILEPFKHENRISKFDLTLWGFEVEEELTLMFEYSTKLFKEGTIEWFIRYFDEILSSILENSEQKLSEIGVAAEEEKKKEISQFTDDLENE